MPRRYQSESSRAQRTLTQFKPQNEPYFSSFSPLNMASKRSIGYSGGGGGTATVLGDGVLPGSQNPSSGAGGIQPPSAHPAGPPPSTAPPRYQPPPQVPGILKQNVSTARPPGAPGVTLPHGVSKVQRRPNPIVGGPTTQQHQPFADDDLIRLLHGVPGNPNASSSDIHKLSRKSDSEGTRMSTDINQAARESARLQSKYTVRLCGIFYLLL